ncbi:HAD hydrolase-like protein [Candidatus Woesearchaeota archaeon]|nr:HAD hydrolase-like protein [Candidatus Woesearchaeota archaeon]
MSLYGLIFDVDGTLIDSMNDQFLWLRHCVTDLYSKKFPFTNYSHVFVEKYNAAVKKEGLPGIYALFGIDYDAEKNNLWTYFKEWKKNTNISLIPGIKDAVTEIYERSRPRKGKCKGLRIALNTTNAWEGFERTIRKEGILNCFDIVLTKSELPEDVNGVKVNLVKPHPYSIELALDLLGTDPEETLHVGDSVVDVRASKNLRRKNPDNSKKALTAAVTWGFEAKEDLEKEKPDFLITEPKQLVQLIEELDGF